MTSAAARRSDLAAVGRDLVSADGRATALLRAHARIAPEPAVWRDLALAPDWLRLPAGARLRLARRVALLAMAGEVAHAIDGAWLGALAERVGEDTLDWAIAHAGDDTLPRLARAEVDALDSLGMAILATGLSPALRHVLPPAGEVDLDAGQAAALIAIAREP